MQKVDESIEGNTEGLLFLELFIMEVFWLLEELLVVLFDVLETGCTTLLTSAVPGNKADKLTAAAYVPLKTQFPCTTE